MASRLDVIEEIQLRYEIPYVTGRGEAIDTITVPVNEQRQGVGISYALVNSAEQRLEGLFPSGGVDSLAQMTKGILTELGVKPLRIILQLSEYSPAHKLHSVEGRAPVNKERDTVLIILAKPPFVYKFGHEMVLWHQATHAKDRWEYRFPAAHPMVDVGEWLDVLWHFSIDGRLEAWGKPHYSRAERLEEAARVLQESCPAGKVATTVSELCDSLWGKETTFAQLTDMGKGLGLESASGLSMLA
jgi:hypothetical protein